MNHKPLYVAVALTLAGCMPDIYRHVDGNESFCYLCFGYYNSHGEKESVTDTDQEVLKEVIDKVHENVKNNKQDINK